MRDKWTYPAYCERLTDFLQRQVKDLLEGTTGVGAAWMALECGKTFSHRGKWFPSGRLLSGSLVEQGAGEFEAHQLIAGDRFYPCDPGAYDPGGLGQAVCGFDHAGGDFQRNLRGER